MYLLDTDVLSALRRRQRNPAIEQWYERQNSSNLHISVITLGEIQRGVSQELRRNSEFADDLAQWFQRVVTEFDDRILQVDLGVARRWGQLTLDIGNTNPDLLIAATALEHDLTVVTRNVRHFEPTGARIVNPSSV